MEKYRGTKIIGSKNEATETVKPSLFTSFASIPLRVRPKRVLLRFSVFIHNLELSHREDMLFFNKNA